MIWHILFVAIITLLSYMFGVVVTFQYDPRLWDPLLCFLLILFIVIGYVLVLAAIMQVKHNLEQLANIEENRRKSEQ